MSMTVGDSDKAIGFFPLATNVVTCGEILRCVDSGHLVFNTYSEIINQYCSQNIVG